MQTPPSTSFHLSLDHAAILRGIWRRHKRLAVGLFLVIAIPALGVIYYTSRPTYVSSTVLTLEVPLIDQIPQLRDFARNTSMGNLLILLKSRSFTEAVVDALPRESFDELLASPRHKDFVLVLKNRIKVWLKKPPTVSSPRDRAIAELQNARMEFAQSLHAPGVHIIKATASHPRVATDLANTYVQVLLGWTRNTNQEESRKTREFLEQQVQQVKESLLQAEGSLSKFQPQRGRGSLAADTELDMNKLAQLEAALAEAEAAREVVLVRKSVLKQALNQERVKAPIASVENQNRGREEAKGIPPTPDNVAPLRTFRAAQDRVARLEEKLSALRERYTEAHPSVQATREELAREQARVGQLARDLPVTPVVKDAGAIQPSASVPAPRNNAQRDLASLEIEDASLQAKIGTLKTQVDWLRKNLGKVGQEEVQLSNLRRSVEVNRNLLMVLTDKLMAARIRQQGEVSAVRIIDPASFPLQTTQSMKYPMLAILLAACVAFGTAYSVEVWRQPVETETDVLKATGLPVVGSVGVFDTRTSSAHNRRGPQLITPLASFQNTRHSQQTAIHKELFRAMRANLETERLKSPFRSVLVTSPGPHEGKSTTILNLAHVFQEFGRRVLLIEADLRRPSLASPLGLTNKPGLVDFLGGVATLEEVCRPLPSGVTVIPGQVSRGDAASLLASSRFKELLHVASTRFDLVLIDSPPILAVPDDLLLAGLVDRVLLVVKAKATSTRETRKAQSTITRANGRLLGVVLNQADQRDVPYYHARYRKYYSLTDSKHSRDNARRSASLPQGEAKNTGRDRVGQVDQNEKASR